MNQVIRTSLKKIFYSFSSKLMFFFIVVEYRPPFEGFLLLIKQHGVVERTVAWEVRDLESSPDAATK